MARDACPSDDVLAAFNVGDLPEAALDSLREHQESCPRCEARAQRLEDRTDAVIDDLRRATLGGFEPGPTRTFDTEPAVGPEENGQGRPATIPGAAPQPVLADYDVDEVPLGIGSMGVVYKARHRKLDRFVALKMIAGTSSRIADLFYCEAKAVAQLQHPNIVQIFEIGQHEGHPFLALEFVGGGALDRRLDGQPLPAKRAAELVRTLALAVDYAHRHGIVHCDLKPSNILITPEGEPKIADFGVAKWLESDSHWGEAGRVIGTPRYMAPEQAKGQVGSIGPATDVYSLGIILFECLHGQPPSRVPATATLDGLREQTSVAVPLRLRLRPKRPSDLETIILKCLAREPAKRYPDAKALADDLGRFLAGNPIQARPVGRAERAYVWLKHHPAMVIILTLASLLIITSGFFSWRYQALMSRHDADLKNLAIPEPNTLYGKQPILVVPAADGSIRLKAFAASIDGMSAALEPKFGNIGHWRSAADRAVWTFQVDTAATFTLVLDYACGPSEVPEPNRFQIQVGGATLEGTVVPTGAWSHYRSFEVGAVTLGAGVHRLDVRSVNPLRGPLFDLRSITLLPQ